MTWVTRETKDRFAHLAHEQGYSESAFLKRLVDGSLAASGGMARQLPERAEPTAASGRGLPFATEQNVVGQAMPSGQQRFD